MDPGCERSGGYDRVLLKLSGQLLGGHLGCGLDPEALAYFAREIDLARREGCSLGAVIGGGNIMRARTEAPFRLCRTERDAIGMLGTLINALALSGTLSNLGVRSRVLTAFGDAPGCQRYQPALARRYMDEGEVVFFAGGTGNAFFTTDTAAVVRALETGCRVIVKGTRVDGVYSGDPEKDPEAERLERLTFREAIERSLGIMDSTAFALCMENDLPIMVVDVTESGTLAAAVRGASIGSLVVPD